MAKKSFAPPVTNFSISCDPSLVDWLNDYAYKKRTTRSKIVRRALVDFRAEHEALDISENAPVIHPEERCVVCGASVLRNHGLVLCMASSHHKLLATGTHTHLEKPKPKVENPIDGN